MWQRAVGWKVPQQEERMVEKAREALPLAACPLTWEDVEISAGPEQGLHANFIDISSMLKKKKKKKKSKEVCSRKGSQQGQRLAPGEMMQRCGLGARQRVALVLHEEAGVDEEGRTRLEQTVVWRETGFSALMEDSSRQREKERGESVGNSPREPAEAGQRLGENVCCPQEGALKGGLGPGGWATGWACPPGFQACGRCWGGRRSCWTESVCVSA